MKLFDYKNNYPKTLTPEIVNLLCQIEAIKERTESYLSLENKENSELFIASKFNSIWSSNKIEGIYTSEKRFTQIISNGFAPINKSEEEIVGYKKVLETIYSSSDYINITPNIILQLHRDLYSFTNSEIGGHFKTQDNSIAQIKNGKQIVIFNPLSTWETPSAISNLCDTYNEFVKDLKVNKLVVSFMFIYDFLAIHPFMDGNGRMSRLLTNLLLLKHAYKIVKYQSLEKEIENLVADYYESLHNTSINWHENKNDYTYFVQYMLMVVLKCYKDYLSKMETTSSKEPAIIKVLNIIKNSVAPQSKNQIQEKLVGVSKITIERSLNTLVKEKRIEKIDSGRNTKYRVI